MYPEPQGMTVLPQISNVGEQIGSALPVAQLRQGFRDDNSVQAILASVILEDIDGCPCLPERIFGA